MLGRLALGAFVLSLCEIGIALAVGHRFFLSGAEVGRYASCALWLHVIGVLAAGQVLWSIDEHVRAGRDDTQRLMRLRLWVLSLVAPSSAWTLWLLTEGRRVRDVPGRGALVVVIAIGAALVAAHVAVRWRAWRPTSHAKRSILVAEVLLALSLACVNALVLRRLYPAFHVALSVITVAIAAHAARSHTAHPAVARLMDRVAGPLLVLACFGLPVSSQWLLQAPNGRFAVAQAAPHTGVWISAWAECMHAQDPEVALEAVQGPMASTHLREGKGIDLANQDVLLITVDALRADRLAAYGGTGLTPHMDALAAEGVVFKRAYTPTPHTSYALASLLTGKFMRPVLDLPQTASEHRTLPQMLRRYGYRTAAFFPPAIFFVDAERFAALSREDFGFEYRKVMFASAQDRVTQLQRYLAQASPKHPVFVWVHLFEPHEPYTPAERFRRGESAQERYDGEVAQADDAVGGLVRVFRAARPGATVILTADHGEEFGDHGGSFHGTTLFDEQVRVPLVWSSPGAPAHVIDAPVETVDVATTLLAAMGIPRDARMRGDNWADDLLSHGTTASTHLAFSDIDAARMVTDGKHKLICQVAESSCMLFDLDDDPRETRNLQVEQPEIAARLRREISAFIGSIPRIEAMSLAEGVGWPHALAAGRLGDRTVGPELVPLLGADEAAWRAGAARLCGELGYAPALQVLQHLRAHDADATVRAEASLATLALGESSAHAEVATLALNPALAAELRLRAALVLAKREDPSAVATLMEGARDVSAGEAERLAAVVALGQLRAKAATELMVELLGDVRLRPAAATALGRIGGASARSALRAAFAQERYPAAREAEARALIALRDPAVRPLIERFLGTDTSVPHGVAMLSELGALSPPSGRGARLVEATAWRGEGMDCDGQGCWPKRRDVEPGALAHATLRLPAPMTRQPCRLTVAVVTEGAEAKVVLDETRFDVPPGAQQVSMLLPVSSQGHALVIAATAGVKFVALAAAPMTDDVPAPKPVPVVARSVDAGVDAAR